MGVLRPQLHMRCALGDLPAPRVPDGYALRPLTAADLPGWVDLMQRNGELGLWSAERAAPLFAGQMELTASFVVTQGDRAVATAQLNPHRLDEYAPVDRLLPGGMPGTGRFAVPARSIVGKPGGGEICLLRTNTTVLRGPRKILHRSGKR